MTSITKRNNFSLAPQNYEQMFKLADMIAKSDLAPKDYKDKPANALIAIQMGLELGLAPMQAIQNIAVINGRPSIWGDAALALVLKQPDCEDVIEEDLETIAKNKKATCIVKRKGREPVIRTFTEEMAKRASLLGKSGPWSTYEPRMYQVRARGFALRDSFADVLKGLILAEEAADIPPEKDVTPSSNDTNQSQMSKLKAKLNIEKKEEAAQTETKPELPQEKLSDDYLKIALEELNNIKTVDGLVDECKELAVKITDTEQRKQLEAAFRKRKTEIEAEIQHDEFFKGTE
jgi:hypothetical protein